MAFQASKTSAHVFGATWRCPGAWFALGKNREMPQRAPPLPEDLLQCLCGFFLFKHNPLMALALAVAFYSVRRTGELLNLQASHVHVSPTFEFAVISLGLTKTSQRTGTFDSVTLRVADVCFRLVHWKQQARHGYMQVIRETDRHLDV
eukprot:s1316_g1.t1